MLLIAGLGNPGSRYKATRHNVGFRFIDLLASRAGIRLNDRRAKSVLGRGQWDGHDVVLAKPRTFMNNSGEGIKYLLDRFGCGPSELLVVYDEMALPAGRIRLRPAGSHAGHNGIRSIISAVHTDEFPRLRIGIGHPPDNVEIIPHVLGRFSTTEEPFIASAIQTAVSAVQCILEENIDAAMNKYNAIGD